MSESEEANTSKTLQGTKLDNDFTLSSLSDNNSLLSVDNVIDKITEFSKALNSSYILPALNCNSTQRENLYFLLLNLNKNIKLILPQIINSLNKNIYKFKCPVCSVEIAADPAHDFWKSLQDHEHFEELYYRLLTNTLAIDNGSEESDSAEAMNQDSGDSVGEEASSMDSNTDSEIEQPVNIKQDVPEASNSPEDVNSFRFNFETSYEEIVEAKLYPPMLISTMRKYDTVSEYSILKANRMKAVCLLCKCEMSGTTVFKSGLVDHIMGQRHRHAASSPQSVELLGFFHDFWMKQEPCMQAHQLYFCPCSQKNMWCALCNNTCYVNDIKAHLMTGSHKEQVMEMYKQGIKNYHLVNIQVQLYGVMPEQVEAKQQAEQLKADKRLKNDSRKKKTDKGAPAAKSQKKSPPVNHNIIKSVEKPESSDPLDLLPHRMKDDLKHFKRVTSPNGESVVVMCNLCKTSLENNLKALKSHIVLTDKHMALRKDKYRFYCEICDVHANSEKAWMKHDFSGTRHVNMAESRKPKVAEYECTTCKLIIYGDDLSLTRHFSMGGNLNKGGRTRTREKVFKLPDSVKFFKSKEDVVDIGFKLTAEAEAVTQGQVSKNCCARLEADLKEQFKNCKVHPFGSRISGIGNQGSDLDVFIDTDGMYYGHLNQDPATQVQLIRTAAKVFLRNKTYTSVVQVLTARTPIIKLHHVPTNLDCDLSFRHGLSVENTKFLRFCIQLQPVLQPLILLVKKCGECVPYNRITNYALAIMCIFFLQQSGHLLSVDKIREINNQKVKSINGWQMITYAVSVEDTKKHVKVYGGSLCELMKDFYQYYAKFDFNSYVVCPLLGRVFKRSIFSEDKYSEFPTQMESYLQQLDSEEPERFRSESFMCIQDPFDLSHNLTKAVQQNTLAKFQVMCDLMTKYIESIM